MALTLRNVVLAAGAGGALLLAGVETGGATAATPGAVASPGPVSPAAPPRAELLRPACRRALDPPARSVAITAVMRPVTGTTRMALKFELERRIGRHGRFWVTRGHSLGTWVYPTNPATLGQNPADVWIRKQNVVNLGGPAYYRFRVEFRWIGTAGRALADVVRRGPLCNQPELRPDLAVGSVTIDPAGTQQDRYVAVVRNDGATASGPFSLALAPGSATSESKAVDSLPPGASVPETFVGPACAPGSSVTVTADPDRQVDDYDRADNALTVACPGSAGSGPGG